MGAGSSGGIGERVLLGVGSSLGAVASAVLGLLVADTTVVRLVWRVGLGFGTPALNLVPKAGLGLYRFLNPTLGLGLGP